MATLTAAELAAGLNLSEFPNPTLERSRPARRLVSGAHGITRLRRRILVSSGADPRVREVAEFLAQRRTAEMLQARERLQPGTHVYEPTVADR